jgi:hypothetical protein
MPQILGSEAAPIVRALEEFRLGLRGMAPPGELETAQWDRALLEEAIEANRAIADVVAVACEVEQVPAPLAELVAKAFEDFATGLRALPLAA